MVISDDDDYGKLKFISTIYFIHPLVILPFVVAFRASIPESKIVNFTRNSYQGTQSPITNFNQTMHRAHRATYVCICIGVCVLNEGYKAHTITNRSFSALYYVEKMISNLNTHIIKNAQAPFSPFLFSSSLSIYFPHHRALLVQPNAMVVSKLCENEYFHDGKKGAKQQRKTMSKWNAKVFMRDPN